MIDAPRSRSANLAIGVPGVLNATVDRRIVAYNSGTGKLDYTVRALDIGLLEGGVGRYVDGLLGALGGLDPDRLNLAAGGTVHVSAAAEVERHLGEDVDVRPERLGARRDAH